MVIRIRVSPFGGHDPTRGTARRGGRPRLIGLVTTELQPRELTEEAEAALVVTWRFEVLSRAGYPREQAFALARSSADLHRAAQLLERGCPASTAVEILL